MRGGSAQAGGSGGAAGWGTVAEGASAPEAGARAAAGPLGAPAAAVCLDVGAVAGPLCTAPGPGPEKAPGAGAPPGAGAVAAGPEGRALLAPRAQRGALCHSPGSSPGFSLDPIPWGQLALHPGCHVQGECQRLTPDLWGEAKTKAQAMTCERDTGGEAAPTNTPHRPETRPGASPIPSDCPVFTLCRDGHREGRWRSPVPLQQPRP